MGQGAQTTQQGGSPSWTPTAALQAASQGQWNPQNAIQPIASQPDQSENILSFLAQQRTPQGGSQLPNPMQRSREQFLAARNEFLPVKQEFQSLEGAERRAMRPEIQEARAEFRPIRDWYRGLQDMSAADQTGMAALGPPRPTPPPQMAPTMQVPNFPGMAPVSNVSDLVAQMQARTANQTFAGGSGGAGGNGNGGDMITTPDGNQMTRDEWEAYQRQWDRPNALGR